MTFPTTPQAQREEALNRRLNYLVTHAVQDMISDPQIDQDHPAFKMITDAKVLLREPCDCCSKMYSPTENNPFICPTCSSKGMLPWGKGWKSPRK